MRKTITLAALVLTACGNLKEALQNSDAKSVESPVQPATTTFQGSAEYAFEIVVDGQKFNDIEHYYTEQMGV